jgi:DNA-binding protein YbaB
VGVAVLGDDAANQEVADLLARLQEQLADVAEMQKKRAALTASAQVADGTVEVTVDAGGRLVKAVIDKSYLDDHDLEDLGGFVGEAARLAAADVDGRVAEMLGPIGERHGLFPSFSDVVAGVPQLRDLVPPGLDLFAAAPWRQGGVSPSSAGVDDDGGGGERDGVGFPTVRR